MDLDKDVDLSKTGYLNIARQKPVRPVNLRWLNIIGILLIIFSLITVGAAYSGNFVAVGCSASAGLLVAWCGIAFLWQSHRQMNDKINALTTLIEKNPKSSRESRSNEED